MAAVRDLTFGFQAAPASDVAKPDRALYDEVIEDCRLGHALGYEAAWMLEHHFSDYFPTPSPLLFLAHVARELPDLGLGTAVLVLPWHHPVRLAEEIAMLSNLTRGRLHLGIGRGTAKMEYDAMGVAMEEARGRFAETLEIVRRGLAGESFTHRGRYFSIPRPVRLRPEPARGRIHFYGAIGSLASGAIMAELGLPPLCLSTFPDHLLARILETWRTRTRERGGDADAILPVSVKLLMADSDAEAQALGRRYFPAFFALQCAHYEVDADPWAGIEAYQEFSRMFGNLRKLTDPEALGPYMAMNLVGAADTVAARLEALAALGFNYVMLGATTPGVPKSLQRESLARFAKEVAPRFSKAFRRGANAMSPRPFPPPSAGED
jgi:alkanesulfonate monooxygenase SsuD/methylene tetrahydromethanopterin reductase-like flavin-dependent oxidoreductase (luciferase family)